MQNKEIIEMIKDAAFFGGNIQNENLEECRNFFDNVIEKQLTLTDVVNSFNLEIKDRDIATIEAMHDTLLDEKVLGLNARSMKESRALTKRMYKALSKD